MFTPQGSANSARISLERVRCLFPRTLPPVPPPAANAPKLVWARGSLVAGSSDGSGLEGLDGDGGRSDAGRGESAPCFPGT